jgi:acyl-coenzyme A thioesterase PaaI-like protein
MCDVSAAGCHGNNYGCHVADRKQQAGGGFNPPEPTTNGGPDYGRFVAAVRDLQDHARAADAPSDLITEAADQLEKVSALLAPFDADEWTSPSGRRLDLPNRGNVLGVPMGLERTDAGRVSGWARFPRFYLGRNGAAHGGAIGLLFDSVLGYTSAVLTGRRYQRTAFLHVDYRAIVPVETTLRLEAALRGERGRKIFVEAALRDGETLLAEANALFVKLQPGQP